MPEPRFENVPVECWMHEGRLGVSPRSVCLFHRRPEEGRELLEALEVAAAGEPYRRTITLAASDRPGAMRTIRLERVEPTCDLKAMHADCSADCCLIRLTPAGAEGLRSRFESWFEGLEDFGFGRCRPLRPEWDLGEADRASAEIWFWGPGYIGP
ncbi:MAG: hypothetical protein AAF907_13715 [Planctomycetota bacterium]